MICQYADSCSGCTLWGIPFQEQLQKKVDAFQRKWLQHLGERSPEIEIQSLQDRGLRDRLDFRWQNGNLGLFDHGRREILDLEECLQLSPALSQWLTDFRSFRWPFAKASLRLRVSPEGLRGVWFDLPHLDVQALLAESSLLQDLLKVAHVEIGQRRKGLFFDPDQKRLRLHKDPVFRSWTRTWISDKPQPLQSRIADFSQPGDAINRLLVQTVARHFSQDEAVIDWGCGSGNLSLPALPHAQKIWALDVDEASLQGLRRTLEAEPERFQNLQVQHLDFHRTADVAAFLAQLPQGLSWTWIVDPPRSGAGVLFHQIPESVQKIIAVSCFSESFLEDAKILRQQGFHCEDLTLVEQFPQTHHAEWVSSWKRRSRSLLSETI